MQSKKKNYKYFQNCKFYFVKKSFFEIKRIFKIACLIGGLLTQVEANKIEDNILKQKLQDLKNREIASRLTGLRLPSCKYIYIIIIIVIIITIIIIITIVKDLVIWVLEVVSHLFYLLKELPFL